MNSMRQKRPLREPVREAPGPKLKNYITPAGLQRLKDEHRFLMSKERPAVTQIVSWAAGNGDRMRNRYRACSGSFKTNRSAPHRSFSFRS